MTPFNPWSRLEAEGRILPSPGRLEAVEATLRYLEQKRAAAAAEHQAKLELPPPKTRGRRR